MTLATQAAITFERTRGVPPEVLDIVTQLFSDCPYVIEQGRFRKHSWLGQWRPSVEDSDGKDGIVNITHPQPGRGKDPRLEIEVDHGARRFRCFIPTHQKMDRVELIDKLEETNLKLVKEAKQARKDAGSRKGSGTGEPATRAGLYLATETTRFRLGDIVPGDLHPLQAAKDFVLARLFGWNLARKLDGYWTMEWITDRRVQTQLAPTIDLKKVVRLTSGMQLSVLDWDGYYTAVITPPAATRMAAGFVDAFARYLKVAPGVVSVLRDLAGLTASETGSIAADDDLGQDEEEALPQSEPPMGSTSEPGPSNPGDETSSMDDNEGVVRQRYTLPSTHGLGHDKQAVTTFAEFLRVELLKQQVPTIPAPDARLVFDLAFDLSLVGDIIAKSKGKIVRTLVDSDLGQSQGLRVYGTRPHFSIGFSDLPPDQVPHTRSRRSSAPARTVFPVLDAADSMIRGSVFQYERAIAHREERIAPIRAMVERLDSEIASLEAEFRTALTGRPSLEALAQHGEVTRRLAVLRSNTELEEARAWVARASESVEKLVKVKACLEGYVDIAETPPTT